MSEKFDVVIAGGAVMGSSTAYHLAADPGFTGRVLVVEKDMTYAKSATALSLSSIRQQFSSPINIRVGLAGVAFLRELKQKLEVDGERARRAVHGKRLSLSRERGRRADPARQPCRAGAGGRANRAAFARRDRGALSLSQRGRRRARRARGSAAKAGSTAISCCRRSAARRAASASSIARRRSSRSSAKARASRRCGSASGERVACGAFVDTAGASGAAEIARGLGVEIPVRSRKRCVFVFEAKPRWLDCPLVIDTNGVYFRPEGRHLRHGRLAARDRGPRLRRFRCDLAAIRGDSMADAWRIARPRLESLKLVRAWACHYDLNIFDHNAIVGRLPGYRQRLCRGRLFRPRRPAIAGGRAGSRRTDRAWPLCRRWTCRISAMSASPRGGRCWSGT